jgi:hypothetical protein
MGQRRAVNSQAKPPTELERRQAAPSDLVSRSKRLLGLDGKL